MLNEEQIIEELLLLNSSIVHDALRIENYSNQTLPNEIIPLQFENIIAGKVWTISGSLKKNIKEADSLLSWTNFLSKAQDNSIIVCQPNNHEIALMGELSAETLKLKKRLNEIYVKHTGQSLKTVEAALERDNFMAAEDAKKWGLIDEIVTQRATSEEE